MAFIIYKGIIQLLIYDLNAQLKSQPKPPKVTHYRSQLTCICVRRPHPHPLTRSHSHTHTHTLPNNRGKCYMGSGKQKALPANGNLLSLLFSQLRPLVALHSNQLRPDPPASAPPTGPTAASISSLPTSPNLRLNPNRPFGNCMAIPSRQATASG